LGEAVPKTSEAYGEAGYGGQCPEEKSRIATFQAGSNKNCKTNFEEFALPRGIARVSLTIVNQF
jgi:hypothetical protein